MAYAVLQTDLTEPSEAQLRQAFEAVPALTAHDARVLARHAVGLIAKGMDADSAAALVDGLEAQGVAAAAVDESDLPALPAPYRLRMAACAPDGLTVYDAMNRPIELPWSAVRIVAAGWVTRTEAEARTIVRARRLEAGGPYATRQYEERRSRALLGELFVDADPARYRLEADRFSDRSPGLLRPGGGEKGLIAFLAAVTRAVPDAAINRGLDALLQRGEKRRYRSGPIFERELTWLRWLIYGG